MGYRSDVGFVVPESAPHFEKLDDDANCFDEIRSEGGHRLYVVESIKWYEGDNLVDAVAKYIAENEDKCLFIRIGEEQDDIETAGLLWNNPFELGFVRRLTYAGNP